MSTVATRSRQTLLAMCLPLIAVVVIIATLPDASHTLASRTTRQGASPYGAASMRASLDPETGALSVNPVPIGSFKMLDKALNRSSEGLVRKTLPDGTISIDLQGRFMSASVAHLDAKGHLHTTCTEDLDTAVQAMEGTSPKSGRKLEVK